MKMRLVQYRTFAERHNNYAVIPDLYLSDFLGWLKLSELGDIVKVTDNPSDTYGLTAPEAWPSYRNCANYVQTAELILC